ncbi:hypothetical protein [Gloeomargarita sp.]
MSLLPKTANSKQHQRVDGQRSLTWGLPQVWWQTRPRVSKS